MKHRELLEMEDLGITDEIRETAYKDQGEERGEEGNWRGIYSYYKYHSYLRAGKQNGILKVEIYRGEDIRKLNEEPVFMIFLSSKENKYTTYLPKEKIAFPLKMNVDDRGSFTELLRSEKCGQVSINISKPGITKGQHWHHSKWEFFMVVSGHGLIQERKIGTNEVIEFEVSGEKIEAVHMLPGYTHNIINLSNTENLVTVMWANELFDSNRPDTYFEPVK